TKTPVQNLEVQITEGIDKGKNIVFYNDYVMLEQGDSFYLRSAPQVDGSVFYSVFEPDRTPTLLFFSILFIALVLIFGGLQGLRGLLSLAGSLLVIVFVLLPSILHGFSPLLVSIGVSSIIIILGSYITHGFNKTTSSAIVGMIATVIITGLMAYFAVYGSNLTGVAGDEAFYLNLNTEGGIDLIGLLMGGIMIGLLGVLYDVSIGQAISVEELHAIAPHIGRWEIYKRAIRIGREHIGALVNTLAIAYVGASLPLLLLFYSSANASFGLIVNREVFATEIIRILIGSIGLVLAVPITTLLAVYMLIKNKSKNLPERVLEEEEAALDNFSHKH
ncbi:MAG TPA: YibE/F family protein, partial [Candidatus Paceibacterota bacterium]|nr:YibE/F family protein [Candidatus Paceibacterota bacterium]